MAPTTTLTDVLVCGAGPVGLVIALGLAQQGVNTMIIEKRVRNEQELYGRACTLYARTLELLEQVHVTDEMLQVGFVGRAGTTFKGGKRVTGRGWQAIFPAMASSFHNYILNITQKTSEAIFSAKYQAEGHKVHYSWEIVDYSIDTSLRDGYNITATLSHPSQGTRLVRCKYLVGADGGQSTVRRLADIAMEGDETAQKWIRIDGKMKTDMPDADLGGGAIESESHGNVLWIKLERDTYRIGFALTPELHEKYPDGITQQQAVEEATNAMYPFQLEIERLDWWTSYRIKQKVAAEFQKHEYILLAGDAAHTHSSGFAQGMNTGVHDATNLIWKLAGVIKGWYKPEVLATYATERRAVAQKLINIDKLAAATISGNIPPVYGNSNADPSEVLRDILQQNIAFTVGLGVQYAQSLISKDPFATCLVAGSRAPDVLLRTPGPSIPVRLQSILNSESKGRWSLLIFVGHHINKKAQMASLREGLTAEGSTFAKRGYLLNMATIMAGAIGGAWAAFDGPAIGKLYFDLDSSAHDLYGISCGAGGIALTRPDGVFAFGVGLSELALVDEFLNGVCA
ncbi:FAD binding domain-containing protein [Xylariaceae sp. AK1471]|nr:FAD binding domain-containing protein [Xylariaceae sp. AK1471]